MMSNPPCCLDSNLGVGRERERETETKRLHLPANPTHESPRSKRRSRPCLREATSIITDVRILNEFALHEPGVARINNGSFGSCPASIIAAQKQWPLLFLRQPDEFYFNHLQPGLLSSRRKVQALINASALVDNFTTAAAIVLQKVSWAFSEGVYSRGDAVVMLHYAYNAIKKSIQAYVSRAGGHVIEVPLPFPSILER